MPRFLPCVSCNGLDERLSEPKEWDRMSGEPPLAWPAIAIASVAPETSRYNQGRLPSHHAPTC